MKIRTLFALLFIGLVSQARSAATFTTTDYITVPDSVSLTPSTNSVTIVAWLSLTSLPSATAKFVLRKATSFQVNDEYGLLIYTLEGCNGAGATSGFVLRVGGVVGTACNNAGIAINTPLCVVATYNGVTRSGNLYINGVSSTTNVVGVSIANGPAGLCIGCASAGAPVGAFDGTIYSVGIYNRAFSQQDATNAYRSQMYVLPDNSTMALYYFDEGKPGANLSGSTVYDSSGNRNNGLANIGASTTLINAKTVLSYP